MFNGWTPAFAGVTFILMSSARADDPYQTLKQELPSLRLTEKDLKISSGIDLPMTIPAVENLFRQPLTIFTASPNIVSNVDHATTMLETFSAAANVLSAVPRDHTAVVPAVSDRETIRRAGVPAALVAPLANLVTAVELASPYLLQSHAAVPENARTDFLSLFELSVESTQSMQQEISGVRKKQKYAGMNSFDQDALLQAGAIVFDAMDTALGRFSPTALAAAGQKERRERIRISTKIGTVVIGGVGDDTYTKEDLKDVAILIDLGGNNTYEGPAAGANVGEIRLVLDYGADITVTSKEDSGPNAACGVYGIGVMALPNPDGVKKIVSGSWSQGAGIGGIGALFINGQADLRGAHKVQGAGAFGVGILSVTDGHHSVMTAAREGQGYGMVRGAGLLFIQGDDVTIKGGLVEPDPREPSGSVSMCQGVAEGDRAFSGGGVGIALLRGDRSSVMGSYFSQGCGYWHSLGIFDVQGSSATIQARRYDQGSGVHSAFGYFHLKGDDNHMINWGVGPAFGWDRAVGSAYIEGSNNTIQADWGTGTASIGSLSFSLIRGESNTLFLPQFGSGGFARNEFSTSLHKIDGGGNALRSPLSSVSGHNPIRWTSDPWGLVLINNGRLDENLRPPAVTWPTLERDEAVRKETINLQAVLKDADKKNPLERISDWLDVAAAFSVDKGSPREALINLLQLPDDQLSSLVELVEPAAVDAMIQLHVILPAYGDRMARLIAAAMNSYPRKKNLTLLGMLDAYRPSLVLPAILTASDSADELQVGTALRVLGHMYNKDTGAEPGLQAELEAIQNCLEHPWRSSYEKTARTRISRLTIMDAYGLLSAVTPLDAKGRLALLAASPADVTEVIGEKGAREFLAQVKRQKKTALAQIHFERAALETAKPQVRKKLFTLFQSTSSNVVTTALIVTGQMGDPGDASTLKQFVAHESASVRMAAVTALARLGEPGISVLASLLAADDVATRQLAISALVSATSEKALPLLERGLSDTDARVRLITIAVLNNLSPELAAQRPLFVQDIKKKISDERDQDVKWAMSVFVK